MRSIQCYMELLVVWGCLCCTAISGQAKENVGRNIPLRWEYEVAAERSEDGGVLQLSFQMNASTMITSQEILSIYPSLVSADGNNRIDFSPVSIAGKIRYKTIMRKIALGKTHETWLSSVGELYDFHSVQEKGVLIQESVPFERWMADGHIVVRENSVGCVGCGLYESDAIVAQVGLPLFGEKDYVYDFIEPEKVIVKYYKDSFDCKVTFPVASYDLQRTFANNKEELVRLEKFISENLSIEGAELKEVRMEGFASPEGRSDYNRLLAEGRTISLSNYISVKYPELKKAAVYQTAGIGEDWEGLKELIKTSPLSNKDELLFIIDRYPTDTERESAIRKLDNGKTYEILLKEFYPQLRRTTFRFSFDVRAYTAEELPGIFDTKPECLSLHEMYELAEAYVSRGDNPLPVYRKAYELFPENAVAVLNYANALLKYGRKADIALQVLSSVSNDSRAFFPMAIAYHIKGNWQKAEELLKEAQKRENKGMSY